MLYEIVFARSARKDLQKLSNLEINRILKKIELLEFDPRPHGCEKLKGEDNLLRIRAGNYRIIYKVSDKNKLIDISLIRHRKDAYK